MTHAISAMLILVAIIHLLPLSGALGDARLSKLYGIPIEEANLSILMRHRAFLFGVLGVFLLVAAFDPAIWPHAFVGGFVSVVSFLALAVGTGGYNAHLKRVVIADIIALIALIVAVVLYFLLPSPG